ncbi:MAG: hypothetical protein ACRDAM_02645, partial [Casimicrobium sp.]
MQRINPATSAFIRYVLWVIGAIVAWAIIIANVPNAHAQASDNKAMGFEDARHLLGRTSFAAQPSEIADYAKLSRAKAVDRLLAETRPHASYPAPEWTKTYDRGFRPDMTQEERQKIQRREQVERALELR